ncbi:XRE family transcriptional regulator [Streptomyces spectabilis]|uniref:XRE family transcriptional regulator n=1 Tax=Streptomyces spectabilis TaxID=68270 RepID=UPI003410CF88
MPNERLRAAIVAGGWTYDSLAEKVQVDPKSVERWINVDRVPRRATALRAAELLGEDVHVLWPALRQARKARAVSPELVALYPHRAELPPAAYADLVGQARERVDVLVYAAVFLHEAYPRWNELLAQRAVEGCRVRIALGDADSGNVQARGQEERFGHGIESRCRLALLHYRPLLRIPGIEIRTHGTTLYNSLHRADDQMLVNSHVWGVNAYGAPVWQLRRVEAGGMFDTYAASFEAVWHTAEPVKETPGGPY